MFTIKTISKYGNEAIYSGAAVSYFSGTDDAGQSSSDSRPAVHVTLNDDTSVALSDGQVFVMNESGKTVAAYRFP